MGEGTDIFSRFFIGQVTEEGTVAAAATATMLPGGSAGGEGGCTCGIGGGSCTPTASVTLTQCSNTASRHRAAASVSRAAFVELSSFDNPFADDADVDDDRASLAPRGFAPSDA